MKEHFPTDMETEDSRVHTRSIATFVASRGVWSTSCTSSSRAWHCVEEGKAERKYIPKYSLRGAGKNHLGSEPGITNEVTAELAQRKHRRRAESLLWWSSANKVHLQEGKHLHQSKDKCKTKMCSASILQERHSGNRLLPSPLVTQLLSSLCTGQW